MTKQTELGKTYWDHNGAFQNQYEELWNELVPATGEASTLEGELIRAAGRLLYEYCNNGNINACVVEEIECPYCGGTGEEVDNYDPENTVECGYCGGTGQVESESYISEFYQRFINLISMHVKSACRYLDDVCTIIRDSCCYDTGYNSGLFSEKNMHAYTRMIDEVIIAVLKRLGREDEVLIN